MGLLTLSIFLKTAEIGIKLFSRIGGIQKSKLERIHTSVQKLYTDKEQKPLKTAFLVDLMQLMLPSQKLVHI